eukprot:COSAG01_NODE_670_length_14354_cov_14.787653_7_plen_48_part_00
MITIDNIYGVRSKTYNRKTSKIQQILDEPAEPSLLLAECVGVNIPCI